MEIESTPPNGVPRPQARERVYAYVRDGLLRGDFRPGAFLEEEQVSAAVGVSRTPVREAFHRLAAERWIDLLPRRGALIRPVTAQELLDVYEARRVIETHAARQLCRDRRPVPAAARNLIAAMRGAEAEAIGVHVTLDHAFHRCLVGTLHNEVMVEMYDGLRARQQRVALSAFGADPSRLDIILGEHQSLLDAIDQRDGDEAERVLERHLRPVAEVMSRLDQRTTAVTASSG